MIQFSLIAKIQRTCYSREQKRNRRANADNANLKLNHVSCSLCINACSNFVCGCGCGFGCSINVDNHTLHTAFHFHFLFLVIPILYLMPCVLAARISINRWIFYFPFAFRIFQFFNIMCSHVLNVPGVCLCKVLQALMHFPSLLIGMNIVGF